jgi:hypothetical protein
MDGTIAMAGCGVYSGTIGKFATGKEVGLPVSSPPKIDPMKPALPTSDIALVKGSSKLVSPSNNPMVNLRKVKMCRVPG